MRRLVALVLVGGLAASACGGGDSDPVDRDVASPAVSDAPSSADDVETDGAEPSTFPITIEHVNGTTVIPAEPTRVVAYGPADHSFALALGVVPIAIRKDFDAQTFRALPWAEAELGDADVALLSDLEPNFEQIAGLEPDLILAVTDTLMDREYEVLSGIAPVVPATSGDLSTVFPWRDATRLTGLALGRADEAEAVIADLDGRFAELQADNPAFVGASIALVSVTPTTVNTWIEDDIRYVVLKEFGLVRPPDLPEPDVVGTGVDISRENLDQVEADIVLWSSEPPSLVGELPGREVILQAAAERREVLLDPILAGALFEASPLSIVYAMDRLAPEFALALDGDPETVPSSAINLYRDPSQGPSVDEAAAMEAWRRVMDPSVAFEDKRPHLADADELADVFARSLLAAEEAGGVKIAPSSAAITAETALVTFEAIVDGTSVPDLTTSLDLVDGVWQARRDEVCSYASLIGVQCR